MSIGWLTCIPAVLLPHSLCRSTTANAPANRQMPIASVVSGKFKKQLNAESETNATKKTWLNWVKNRTIRKFKNKIKYKLRKLNFMTHYKALMTSFLYEVKIEDTIVGNYTGKITYGQNQTTFDSVIEAEFVPYPIITTIKGIIVPENYNYFIKTNLKDNVEEQIMELFNNFSIKLIQPEIENQPKFTTSEKKLDYTIYVWSDEINFEMRLSKDNVFFNKKIVTLFPSLYIVHYPIDKDNDNIISDAYDIINKKLYLRS
jgi:hypothetical protein